MGNQLMPVLLSHYKRFIFIMVINNRKERWHWYFSWQPFIVRAFTLPAWLKITEIRLE